ncbi:hypothetical protein SCHPADRAFT_915078 [Schizopora paradoxa]|uniref:C3H1-type domain-containing protein n=1 Tax=Schizopora paradoxa TaxID=27342 RepID=A0A0H2SAQ8_9AGAM|nr:hypothetical protein SCHPADRAFT_915078 [Schizopora paradoxa]
MLYETSHRDELKAWLVKALEPICDAEPEALAAYVLALLNHDAPELELRKEMVKQLEEFLEGGSASFVESLFATLRSKSYIPYSTTPAEPSASSSTPYRDNNAAASSSAGDSGIPIPLDALLSASVSSASSPGRGQKRGLEDDGSGYQQGPSKGARLYDGQSTRQNGHEMENGTVFQSREGMGRGAGATRWLPNGVCRDYHIKGYCARGATCKYSHDDSAFAPGPAPGGMPFNPMMGPMGMPGPMPGMPFMPMMPFPMLPAGSPTYDPNEAHMDMGPAAQNQPPHQGMAGQYGVNGMERQEGADMQGAGQPNPSTNMLDQDVQMQNAQNDAHMMNGNSMGPSFRGRPSRGGNPSFRGRGRGGHGTFSNDHQSFGDGGSGGGGRSRNDSKTIVVEKIPPEHLSLEAVNGWFKRFGTVTNVAVDANGAKSLVSFATHDEAYSAWKSEEAVFGNRFVKVFWHRPMEGQGVAGARALQASAGMVAGMAAREKAASTGASTPSAPTPPPHSSSTAATKSSTQSSALSALAAKQQKLEKLIAEQKELMGKLSSASPAEKKEIMARLRKLDAEMIAAKSDPSPPPPSATKNGHTPTGGKEQKAKELLDMELDAHAQSGGESQSGAAGDSAETTESLQEKLARLRAEASALGISDTPSPTFGSSPYRGYRGRGRGRGFFRGAMRGGPPRSSMKLDNRTKSLVVRGVKAQDPEYVQAVRGWYELFQLDGQVDSVEVQDDDSIVVAFRSRAAAEQALAKGSSFPPPVGTVKLSWHEPAKATPSSSSPTDKKPSIPTSEDRPPSPRPEDIPDESGWGEVDDGMGMF